MMKTFTKILSLTQTCVDGHFPCEHGLAGFFKPLFYFFTLSGPIHLLD